MKVLIAIDSFKGSLTSSEASGAIRDAILELHPGSSVETVPIADGGEGTMDALRESFGATQVWVNSVDPLAREIVCSYAIAGKTAIMDMSASAGITLLSESERDPMHATTYGVGLMIRDAISRSCRDFIVGIGGSATNDGGAGMLDALGFKLLDGEGKRVPFGAYGAGCVAKIDDSEAIPELSECTFRIACDVTNPLLGENGCTYVFSPQKGAKQDELALMDSYLASYAEAVKKYNPSANPTEAGCGAAGGIGFAFLAFLHARLLRGIDLVMEATRLEEKIKRAELVITGEGKMDYQSSMGKAPIGVAKLAKKHSKRVVALCGITGEGYESCLEYIDKIYPIADKTKSVEWNMKRENALSNLKRTVKKSL